ncbi:MAG: hypothetical protein QM783_04190 [Phycisphaerales bacterium]
MPDKPLAYFLTWTCHGTWLHGDLRGSVDSRHNKRGHPRLAPDEWLQQFERRLVGNQGEYLTQDARESVNAQLVETCAHRRWTLRAKYVGTNHVHVVVSASADPDKIAEDLKAWATRRLNEQAGRVLKPWTEGASTIYLWTQIKVDEKVDYVHRLQTGEARARKEITKQRAQTNRGTD